MSRLTNLATRVATSYIEDHAPSLTRVQPSLRGWLRAGNVAKLATCSTLSDEYHPEEWLKLRQVEALFKKNSDFTSQTLCSANAEDSFRSAELRCASVNEELDQWYTNGDQPHATLIERMQKHLSSLFGDISHFYDMLPSLARVTSGATEDRSRKRAIPFLKVDTRHVRAPSRAFPLLRALASFWGVQEPLKLTNVDTNRITLVPKNWKTHRTIACEPTHALPVQLAVDSYLKTRLRRWGIDLSDQTRNQEMARLGSLDPIKGFATLDLQQASDSLAYNVVALLIPSDWFRFLESVRSSGYTSPWGEGTYAKFSSMGNGYTFTLETAIFAAACKAVGAKNWSVYGDDIIIEPEKADEVVGLLGFLGFTLNSDKSFVEGPFRESCGCDWYRGSLVTPFYLRRTPRNRADWNHVVNQLAKLGWPGSSIWNLTSTIMSEHGLLCVPYAEATTLGVHVNYTSAIQTRVAWVKSGITYTKGCSAEAKVARRNFGVRSLMLWFFQKPQQDLVTPRPGIPIWYTSRWQRDPLASARDARVVSTIYSEHVKYRNGTCVHPGPIYNEPVYLASWTEYLTRCNLVKRRNVSKRNGSKRKPGPIRRLRGRSAPR
jgi:hypothetical protein